MLQHLYASNHCNRQRRVTMAHLHVAQIGYLSQDLIERMRNANNLIVRSKVELDLMHQTVKMLLNVFDELEKDLDHGRL
jgi:hypothetical protein